MATTRPRGHSVSVQYTSEIPEFIQKLEFDRQRRLFAAGNIVRNHLLEVKLVGERTGRTYRIPNTGIVWTASRPGEPPATRLGDLRRSYQVYPRTRNTIKDHVMVGSRLDYAYELEVEMDRPHLMPSFVETRDEVYHVLTDPEPLKRG